MMAVAIFEKGPGELKKEQEDNEKVIVKADVKAIKVEQIELRERQAVVEAQYQQILAILSDIKREIAKSRTEIKREIAETKREIKREIAESRAGIKREIAGLRTDMRWCFGSFVVLAGLILAAFKLF